MREKMRLICPTSQVDYFSTQDWTRVLGLKDRAKLVFKRKENCAHPKNSDPARTNSPIKASDFKAAGRSEVGH